MGIRKKIRVRRTVNYHVTCENCRHTFVQVGRPYNFWRDIKKRYKLSADQLRSMQASTIGRLLETGELVALEEAQTIRTGDMIFIKPDRNHSS